MTEEIQPRSLSIEERRNILQRYVIGYVRSGYQIALQTDTTAQLIKPKRFGCLWASLWFLLFGIGLLFYLFYYWAKKDEVIHISVNEYGKVFITRN